MNIQNPIPNVREWARLLSLLLLLSNFITIAHIGDSRCYILNEAGFSQVTEDHSLVNEFVRSGQITKEDAENHPA